MVIDGAGFDELLNCLCNNRNATKTDLPENCTTEKGIYESNESILNECLSTKRKVQAFCSVADKIMDQQRLCKTILCMVAVMNCTERRNDDKIINSDAIKNTKNQDKQRTTEKESNESILNECLSTKRKVQAFCSVADKIMDQQRLCKTILCMVAVMNCTDSDSTTDSDKTALNGNEIDRRKRRKNRRNRRHDRKEQIFKVGAIVGTSVGIAGTIILVLVILAIIYVCRQRSKKKKRKQLTTLQAIGQRFEMAHHESSPSSTNKGEYTILSTNKSLNTNEAQGEYFVLDPSITKYDKDLSNRKLPEIKRFSGAEGDENVYYEIDEDKIESSTDIEGVHKKKIEEVRDQGSHHSDLAINQTQLGSKKKNTEQLTRPQSFDQKTEMANLESSSSSTFFFSNTYDDAQGEYFVLDPSVTKYDKDLVLPEVKGISVIQGDEKVYNEIDEDKIESSTDMKVDHQKQIEEARDTAIYHANLTNNQNQLGFDNTTYNVTSEVDD
ncbi:unnamed protein product [Mytilus coruscus]|uniref:Uncharacterized protein n=1 Tax=Mytilus coruscus TaxID=42192 RepID=A0A6J8ELU8_MYTCO|nr:unnamed protein product [Mytilus coruscus]